MRSVDESLEPGAVRARSFAQRRVDLRQQLRRRRFAGHRQRLRVADRQIGRLRRIGRGIGERGVVVGARADQHDAQHAALGRRQRATQRRHRELLAGRGVDRAERFEQCREVRTVARAVSWLFRERARDELVELHRQLRPQLVDVRRVLEQDLREHGHHVVADERAASRQALEQHAAEREHVRARSDIALAARLLRRHVAGRADHDAGARREAIAVGDARDAEVEQLHAIELVVRQEQVRRLDVAMHDAAFVRGAERFGDPPHQRDALAAGQPLVPHAVIERLAVEPLHREPQLARVRAAVGDVAHDAGMAQRREHADLAREAFGVIDRGRAQHLDRDGFSGLSIDRAKHRTHPARARHPFELEPVLHHIAGLHVLDRSLTRARSS